MFGKCIIFKSMESNINAKNGDIVESGECVEWWVKSLYWENSSGMNNG